MNYKITRWETHNSLEETGDDICTFHIFLSVNDEPELAIPVILHLDDLEYHIKGKVPKEYDYIQKIWSSFHGYGPKHSKVMAVLEEEGYDFFPHIQTYVTPKVVESIYEFNHRKIDNPEAFEKKVEEFRELFTSHSLKDYNIRYTAFLDSIDIALHELTVKYFPELFEKGDKTIKAYKNELINTTMAFARTIDKLAYK